MKSFRQNTAFGSESSAESHSYETILSLIKRTNAKEETETFLVLKIVLNFFETNSFSKANNINEFIEYISELLIHKSKRKKLFALKILEIILKTEKAPYETDIFNDIMQYLIEMLKGDESHNFINQIISIFSNFFRLNNSFCTELLSEVDIKSFIDLCSNDENTYTIFSFLDSLILNADDDQTIKDQIIEVIEPLLGIVHQILQSDCNQELLVYIIHLTKYFLILETSRSMELMSEYGILQSFTDFLSFPNSYLVCELINLFSTIVASDIDLDQEIYSTILNIYNSSDEERKKAVLTFMQSLCSVNKHQVIVSNEYHLKLIENVSELSFNMKEIVISIVHSISIVLPNYLITISSNESFIEALINVMNESNDFVEDAATLFIALLDSKTNNEALEMIKRTGENEIDFDSLLQKEPELGAAILERTN